MTEEYYSSDRLGFGSIKSLYRGLDEWENFLTDEKKTSKAFDIGRLVEFITMEMNPESFWDDFDNSKSILGAAGFQVNPFENFRSKEAQALRDSLPEGIAMFNIEDLKSCVKMAKNASRNLRVIIDGFSEKKTTLDFKSINGLEFFSDIGIYDPWYGSESYAVAPLPTKLIVPCKAKPDIYLVDGEERKLIVDLKTTIKPLFTRRECIYVIDDYLYDMQLLHYLNVVSAEYSIDTKYLDLHTLAILLVSKVPPYRAVTVYLKKMTVSNAQGKCGIAYTNYLNYLRSAESGKLEQIVREIDYTGKDYFSLKDEFDFVKKAVTKHDTRHETA